MPGVQVGASLRLAPSGQKSPASHCLQAVADDASWYEPGGHSAHCANEAVGVARLGVRTTLVGRVGGDEMGRLLLEHLSSATETTPLLRTAFIVQRQETTTGVAVQLVTSRDGRKANVICQGANMDVDGTEAERALQVMAEVAEDALARQECKADLQTQAVAQVVADKLDQVQTVVQV